MSFVLPTTKMSEKTLKFDNIRLQMSGYIKYFENGGNNMFFLMKDDDVLD